MFPVKYRWPVFAARRRRRRRTTAPSSTRSARSARARRRSASSATCRSTSRDDEREPLYLAITWHGPGARAATTWRRSSARRSRPGRTTGASGTRAGLRRVQPDHRRRRGRSILERPARRRTSCTSSATRGRRTPTPRSAPCRCRSAHYMLGWTRQPVPRARSGASGSRARLHIVRAEDVMADSVATLWRRSATRSASSAPSRSRDPSWNGKVARRRSTRGARSASPTPEANRRDRAGS